MSDSWSLPELLDQDEFWATPDGHDGLRVIALDDMSLSYLGNLREWLLDHAASLHSTELRQAWLAAAMTNGSQAEIELDRPCRGPGLPGAGGLDAQHRAVRGHRRAAGPAAERDHHYLRSTAMIMAAIRFIVTAIIVIVVASWFIHHGGEAGSWVHEAVQSAKEFVNGALG